MNKSILLYYIMIIIPLSACGTNHSVSDSSNQEDSEMQDEDCMDNTLDYDSSDFSETDNICDDLYESNEIIIDINEEHKDCIEQIGVHCYDCIDDPYCHIEFDPVILSEIYIETIDTETDTNLAYISDMELKKDGSEILVYARWTDTLADYLCANHCYQSTYYYYIIDLVSMQLIYANRGGWGGAMPYSYCEWIDGYGNNCARLDIPCYDMIFWGYASQNMDVHFEGNILYDRIHIRNKITNEDISTISLPLL